MDIMILFYLDDEKLLYLLGHISVLKLFMPCASSWL